MHDTSIAEVVENVSSMFGKIPFLGYQTPFLFLMFQRIFSSEEIVDLFQFIVDVFCHDPRHGCLCNGGLNSYHSVQYFGNSRILILIFSNYI